VARTRTRNEITICLALVSIAALTVQARRAASDIKVIQSDSYSSVSPQVPARPSYRVESCIIPKSIRPAIPLAELAAWSRVADGQPCGTADVVRCEAGILIAVTRSGWIRWDTCDGMTVDTFVTAPNGDKSTSPVTGVISF
jgi:hypothetical protein